MSFYKENWFRWIAILPGSVLAYLIVMFPVHWFVMFIYYSDIQDNYWLAKIQLENLELLFSSFICPLILITISSEIAPRYKSATGLTIAIGIFIIDAYMALEFIHDLQNGGNETSEWIRICLTIALALTGIFLGLRNAFRERKQEDL